ncbi:MAG: esterase YqiA, partial [gamma proteobacterium symbiont of Bathyaustriella thionipta]|nr:esterase YqiA [gamma proteobacterium symbiont of Bathyaustriella thionipta]
VLVNPAVNPQALLFEYIGKNKNYHTGEEYEFTVEHIKQLEAIYIESISSPRNLMVLLQKEDEVLDYRLAEKKYSDCQLLIEEGGDHSFQNFEQHCEQIYQFLTS